MSLEADTDVRRGGFRLGVRLDVADGELVAILGPNGAGKTTLLRALSGLLRLAAGRVAVDGRVLDDVSAGVWIAPEQRPMAIVNQHHWLFPHLSAAGNVAFGLRARGVDRDTARRRAHEWLERLGLGRSADSRPAALSGGESQRVSFARALITEPRVLLLDEPFAAADISARSELRQELRRYLGEHGGLGVLVTHDPGDALALAARVLVLEEGRVVQQGSMADVRSRPRSPWAAGLSG